jgi:hypothetical protein
MSLAASIEDGLGPGSLQRLLEAYEAAVKGEHEPMRCWGVDVSARTRVASGMTLAELVATQLRSLEP